MASSAQATKARKPSQAAYSARRAANAATAKETRTVLPDILKQLPGLAASRAEALYLDSLPPLRAADCPGHHPPDGKVAIRVVNSDTLNAAIDLAAEAGAGAGRVAVLNMASHANPGGGWLSGASAQEESLCYRSSLSLSLHRSFYPFRQRMGLYTPDVVVIRSDMASGHKLLLPDSGPEDLPVVSVLSIAALRRPDVARRMVTTPDGPRERRAFAKASDRDLTKDKMRLCLRMAASRGHGSLVLGALGCGAFENPPEEVAHCWLEVLRESEFRGGWWKELWFAVFDRRGEGNFDVFERVLGGEQV